MAFQFLELAAQSIHSWCLASVQLVSTRGLAYVNWLPNAICWSCIDLKGSLDLSWVNVPRLWQRVEFVNSSQKNFRTQRTSRHILIGEIIKHCVTLLSNESHTKQKQPR